VKAIFATSGCLARRSPTTRARADDDVQHALGQPRVERDLLQLQRGQGVSSAGFRMTALPGGECRRDLPRRDRQREVPGDDQSYDAERFAERHVHSAGNRNRVAEQPLRRAGVVVEHVNDHADLAPRVADRLTDVARLELCDLVEAIRKHSGDVAHDLAALGWGDRAPLRKRGLRAGDGRIGLVDTRVRPAPPAPLPSPARRPSAPPLYPSPLEMA